MPTSLAISPRAPMLAPMLALVVIIAPSPSPTSS